MKTKPTARVSQNPRKPRKREELLDWVGSSYSANFGISYRPCSKQEAWDLYIDGETVVFSSDPSIDASDFALRINKAEYHRTFGFDRTRFSFNDLCRQMREQMAEVIGPNHELHIAVVV